MNLTLSDVFHAALAVLASLGGGAAIVILLSGWLGKVWADRLMQNNIAKHNKDLEELKSKFEAVNQRLKTELDKTLHVHHLQFETEFRAMTDIWAKVSAVRSSIAASPATVEPETSQADKLRQLTPMVERVSDGIAALKHAVHDQSPFYPEVIYEKLDELIMALVEEEQDLQKQYSQGNDIAVSIWFETNHPLVGKISDLADQISKLMRERIDRLSVYRE